MTDRYTDAIEQLRSDTLDVRIDGIKALEHIAGDSAEYHPKVMEVLTKFIREHSREPWLPAGPRAEAPEWATRRDVQEAFTVVGRRDTARDIQRIDLTGAVLDRAYLGGAVLDGAVLDRAYLDGAVLTGTVLRGANLIRANLRGADLTGADLTGAWWPRDVQVPEGWTADGESGRLKPAGQLSEVTDHYL